MKDNSLKKVCTNDKELNVMPTIEMIEYERVAYIEEMKEYLRNLKGMKPEDAQKLSRENLLRSNIIQDNGDFAERYYYSRMNQKRL